jgi:hypothetical protein
MSEGLLGQSRLIAYMSDGSKHEVMLKPRHVKAIQIRFRDEEPVDMERTIYTCWLVLRDTGDFPGTLEEFELQLDDIGVPEDKPGPKVN